MTEITLPAKDGGVFTAYMAVPAIIPAPTIILIQEIFGVNAEMRAKCDEFAAQGYMAVCPDLFWRMEPGVQLTDKTDAEWTKAFDFFKRFDVDKGVEDLRAVHHTFKGHAHSTGKVGTVGYCLGGKLAYLMATRSSVECAVSYYGVGLDELLDESTNITHPLMLHIAEEDEFVNKEAQTKIKTTLASHPQLEIYSYPGVNHAFARGEGINYSEEAATAANTRTDEFFDRILRASKETGLE